MKSIMKISFCIKNELSSIMSLNVSWRSSKTSNDWENQISRLVWFDEVSEGLGEVFGLNSLALQKTKSTSLNFWSFQMESTTLAIIQITLASSTALSSSPPSHRNCLTINQANLHKTKKKWKTFPNWILNFLNVISNIFLFFASFKFAPRHSFCSRKQSL